MVMQVDDLNPLDVVNFFQRISQMAKKQSKTAVSNKELEPISLTELQNFQRQLDVAAKRLTEAIEKMASLNLTHIMGHVKTVRTYIPVVRNFASNTPKLAEDQYYSNQSGQPTSKELQALKHAKAKLRRAKK